MKWNDFGKNNQIGSSIKVYYSVFFSNQILIKYQFSLLRIVVVGRPFAPFFEEKKSSATIEEEREQTHNFRYHWSKLQQNQQGLK